MKSDVERTQFWAIKLSDGVHERSTFVTSCIGWYNQVPYVYFGDIQQIITSQSGDRKDVSPGLS